MLGFNFSAGPYPFEMEVTHFYLILGIKTCIQFKTDSFASGKKHVLRGTVSVMFK